MNLNNTVGVGDHKNKGVKCDVKNCVYHDGKKNCSAEKIDIGPTFAVSSNDTICATFKSN